MKKITSYLMVAIGVSAIAFTSCKDPEVAVPEYELGTPTLTATVSETTSYTTTIAMKSNKVTRMVYYLVEEAATEYTAPTAEKVRQNGFKETIKEKLDFTIDLKNHKSYKIALVGQGLDNNNQKVYTDVTVLDVVTPADPKFEVELYSATKSRLTVRAYFTDVEKAYFKFVTAGSTAPTEAELLAETAVTKVSTDSNRNDAEYFNIQSANDLANETLYDFYTIGVNEDGSKTIVYKLEKLETKAATSVTLTAPTLTATTATLKITTNAADIVKVLVYDGTLPTKYAEILEDKDAKDISAEYANQSAKEYVITGLKAKTKYKVTVAAKRTSATGMETTGYAYKTFTTATE